MKKFILKYVALLVLFALSFYSVSSYYLNTPPSLQQVSQTPQYEIQAIVKSYRGSLDFWLIVEQGLVNASQEYNVSCKVTGVRSEDDIQGQIQLIEQAIEDKPDALIIAATDYEQLVPVCEKAADVGIQIITLDSDIDSTIPDCFVGTDNYRMGKEIAFLLEEDLQEGEQVAVISHYAQAYTALERKAGLLENIPNLEQTITTVINVGSNSKIAKEQTILLLQENPDISYLVGLNEGTSLGICYALEELGLKDQIKVIACDSSEKLVKYLENGTIDYLFVQNPFSMGYFAVEETVNILSGKPFSNKIDTGSVLITKDNMRLLENQKLLFPFTK